MAKKRAKAYVCSSCGSVFFGQDDVRIPEIIKLCNICVQCDDNQFKGKKAN